MKSEEPSVQSLLDRISGLERQVAELQSAAERLHAENESLAEEAYKFRMLTDVLPDIFWISAAESGELLYLSPAFETVWGRSRQSMYEDPWSFASAIHPEDRDWVLEHTRAHLTTGWRAKEWRIVRPDGSVRWLRDVCVVVPSTNGYPTYLTGVSSDITELKDVQQALKETNSDLEQRIAERTQELKDSERRFQIALADSPITVFSLDKNLRYTWSFNHHPSFSLEDIIGRTNSELLCAEDAAAIDAIKRLVLSTRKGVRREISVTLGGERYIFDITYEPLFDDGGAVIGIIGASTDITARKRIEEETRRLESQLLQTQKEQSLADMAGGIAHDYNNLLAAILGNADLAAMLLGPGHPVGNHLQAIITATTRATVLTHQMLAYSGRGHFRVEQVDLSSAIGDMPSLLASVVHAPAVCDLNLATELPPIKADVTQIRQLVLALVTNASEAVAATGGRITIATGTMRATAELLASAATGADLPAGLYVFLRVSDTGPGIPPSVLPRIFDPFFSTKFVGRGLGLSASQGIVRGHNGAILVSSLPGQETSFTILFHPAQPDE